MEGVSFFSVGLVTAIGQKRTVKIGGQRSGKSCLVSPSKRQGALCLFNQTIASLSNWSPGQFSNCPQGRRATNTTFLSLQAK